MQLEHWFNELEKTGIPGIICEKPNSSTQDIFEHVLHSTTTNGRSSTKCLKSWTSKHALYSFVVPNDDLFRTLNS